MKKRYAALIAAAVIVFGGCGKVTEPENNKEKLQAAAVNEITTGEEETTEPDTENEIIEDKETTAELDDYDFQQYYDYIVGDGYFGFDMYNYGHIRESWDNRAAGAWLLLEGMALPGTEERVMDVAVSLEELNRLETEGFMLNMKFEDNKTFRVGSEKIEGCGINLIGYENSFIFCVEYFDENEEYTSTPYYELEIEYIPMIVDAVQYGKSVEEAKAYSPLFIDSYNDTETDTETETHSDHKLDDGDITDKENGIVCYVTYNGESVTENVDTAKILETALEALADESTVEQMLNNLIDDGARESWENGLIVHITFAEFPDSEGYNIVPRDIAYGDGSLIKNDHKVISNILIYGMDGRYGIGVDGESEMALSPEYGDKILHEGLGL